jgi:hypothetical protein
MSARLACLIGLSALLMGCSGDKPGNSGSASSEVAKSNASDVARSTDNSDEASSQTGIATDRGPSLVKSETTTSKKKNATQDSSTNTKQNDSKQTDPTLTQKPSADQLLAHATMGLVCDFRNWRMNSA